MVDSPAPGAERRSNIRAAVLYAILLSVGALIGFIAAGLTGGARGAGDSATVTATPDGVASGSLAGPTTSAVPDASVQPSPTLVLTAGPVVAPPMVTFGDRLATNGIELALAWQPPSDGSRAASYDLGVSRDGGAFRSVGLARKTSRRATIAAAADHAYVVRLRARDPGGTRGPYAESSIRLTRIDDAGSEVRASKGWKVANHRDYSGAGARYATTAGAEFSLAFDGTGIAIIGPMGPGRGRADVFIDGQHVGRFDAGADVFRPVRLLMTVDQQTAGPHVLTVRVAGTNGRPMVAVDAILVLSQTQ
ncbi:MAG: hypothetical protein ABWY52_01030 [Candidatus Limnocylindrales bacterium]